MAKIPYSEQLRHPNWQKKRLEVMESAAFSCENCGDTETTLNVHHRRYVKGRMVWEYERRELQCLCERCHRTEHESRELLDQLLMQADVSLQRIVFMLAGFFDGSLLLNEDIPVPAVFRQEFELGVLVSILDGQMPDVLHRAYLGAGPSRLTPTQEMAVERWQEFSANLEKSGP